MADDNQIKPIALAHATVLLKKLNAQKPIEQTGELIRANERSIEQEPVNLSDTIIKLFESINETLLRIEVNFDEMFRQMAIDRLAMLEARAEDQKPALKEKVKQQQGNEESLDLGFILTPLGIFAAAIGAAIGMIVGQVQAIGLFFRTAFPKMAADIGKGVAQLTKSIQSGIAATKVFISNAFTSVANFFKGIGTSIKAVVSENKILAELASRVKTFFAPFVTLVKSIGGLTKGAGAIGSIVSRFSLIGNMLKAFSATVGSVAKIVGKIFYPLTVVLTLWDTVKGAFEGWEDGGFVGAIQGALVGFVTSLITKPLDLLKDGVSWIADKLGFENFSNLLDSFSFTDLYKTLVNAVFTPFQKIQDFIVDLFSGEVDLDYLKNMFGNIKDFVEEGLKKLLRMILPDKDSLLAKVIPNSLYEFAESPTPKEERVAVYKEQSSRRRSLDDRRNDGLKRQQAAGAAIAQEMGIDPSDAKVEIRQGKITSINGEAVPEELQQKSMGMMQADTTRPDSQPGELKTSAPVSPDLEPGELKTRAPVSPDLEPGELRTSPSESQDAIASRAFDTPQITRIEREEETGGFFSNLFVSKDKIDVTPVPSQRQASSAELTQQTSEREEAKAAKDQGNVNVVNAPSTSTTNNVSSQAAFFESPSATDGLGQSYSF